MDTDTDGDTADATVGNIHTTAAAVVGGGGEVERNARLSNCDCSHDFVVSASNFSLFHFSSASNSDKA